MISGNTTLKGVQSANLFRRLGAILYDSFILLGIILIAAIPLPLLDAIDIHNLLKMVLKQIYLIAICFLYFGGFWVVSGQTIGMRAWRIKLTTTIGSNITWVIALCRFSLAFLSLSFFALGFIWIIFDREGRAWHDVVTKTKVIFLIQKT